MRAAIYLADHAEVVNGKVHAMGLGWTATQAPTPPFSVVLLIKVPWSEANRQFQVKLELLDADGHLVELGPPNALGQRQTLTLDTQLEVGRPPGVPPGTDLDSPLAIKFGELPLEAGSYEFRLSIDGQHRAEWGAPFITRPAAQGPQLTH